MLGSLWEFYKQYAIIFFSLGIVGISLYRQIRSGRKISRIELIIVFLITICLINIITFFIMRK